MKNKQQKMDVGVQHPASTCFIELHSNGLRSWLAVGWSGFIVRLLLSKERCFFQGLKEGVVCVEIDDYGVDQLMNRADIVEKRMGYLKFQIATPVRAMELLFKQWEKNFQ